jgi:hypothetical protein
MSVLRINRNESPIEYVRIANLIYEETYQFLSRVSARYERLIGPGVMTLVDKLLDNCDFAEVSRGSTTVSKELRERYLREALGAVSALDIKMSHLYNIMTQNPQGCFTMKNGDTVKPDKAVEKLNKMSQSLGEKIDTEISLIKKVLCDNLQ